MDGFASNGVEISYRVEGEGDPVLLIHGFASNAQTNWADTRWMSFLAGNGFRAIAFDNRGHGTSQKFYEPDAYSGQAMADDARHLLDRLANRSGRRHWLLDGRAHRCFSGAQLP